MKSLCIKTNNSNLLQYLLNELRHLELDNVCFSLKNFKHYNNIIIHYNGNNISEFINKISYILSIMVIDELEEQILTNIISQNYFYFNADEQKEIVNLCFDIMIEDFSNNFDQKLKMLNSLFYNYLLCNKSLHLTGFLTFRIQNYINILDTILNEAVSSFIIKKEYLEFVSILRLYINSQKSNCNTVHLIYLDNQSILLDENKQIIDTSSNLFNAKYLSDITFSNNDYILNTLLTLLPNNLYIHLINTCTDEFINTLKTIFEHRVTICTDCNICSLYSMHSLLKDKTKNHF